MKQSYASRKINVFFVVFFFFVVFIFGVGVCILLELIRIFLKISYIYFLNSDLVFSIIVGGQNQFSLSMWDYKVDFISGGICYSFL